jgi:hypothetical protein
MSGLPLDPADWSCCARLAVLFGALVAGAVCNVAFGRAKRVMTATGGPGIVGFEFIGSWKRADAALACWNTGHRNGWRAARWATAVDIPFIATYAIGLGTLARLASDHAYDRGLDGWGMAGLAACGAFLAAAVFDLVEDIALFCVLAGKRPARWPTAATFCAVVKFALLAIGALVVVTVGVAFLGPT